MSSGGTIPSASSLLPGWPCCTSKRDQPPQSEVSFEAKKATKLDSSHEVGPSDPGKANIAPVQSW